MATGPCTEDRAGTSTSRAGLRPLRPSVNRVTMAMGPEGVMARGKDLSNPSPCRETLQATVVRTFPPMRHVSDRTI
jgi:hypothetical protein